MDHPAFLWKIWTTRAGLVSSITPLLATLIGAGGAVFGGALTTGGQLLIERGRTRNAQSAEQGREARAMRLAVRLVIEELAENASMIEDAAQAHRYWVGPRELSTETWSEYRVQIATGIDSTTHWRQVTAAYDAISNLNWTVEHRRGTDQSIDAPVHGARVASLDNTRSAWRRIQAAIGTLEATIGVGPDVSRIEHGGAQQERRCWPYGDGADFDQEAASIASEEAYREQMMREAEES